MNINNIIKDLYKYKNEENNTIFLKKVIKYFEKKKDIIEINDNEFELSGIKIHLLYNDYKFIISSKIIDNYSYRKLKLNEKQFNNIINQRYGLENNDFKICKKLDSNNKYPIDLYIIIIHNFNTSNHMLKMKEEDFINIELALVLLGIESLYFLNHQNLDNYCSDIILNNSAELLNNLKIFKNILNKIPWIERDRIIIFSGLIYHFLGTLYTKDIDINILCNTNEQKEKYIEYFKDSNIDIVFLVKDSVINPIHEWLYYKLPQIRNIDSIYTTLINPKYHFYFMGIKCIDILTNFQSSTNRRANAVSINDTILLKKINNIDFYNIFCIKNFRRRSKDNPRIFTDTVIYSMFNNVINIMKKWWNIDINIDYLKSHFHKCDILFKDIDYNYIKYCNKYTKKLLKYNEKFIESIIYNYIKNKTIYDIGFNRMTYLKLYCTSSVKYIYGIDTSIYNINYVSKKLEKYNKKNNLINEEKYNLIKEEKYNLIKEIKYNLINGLFTDKEINTKKVDVILLLYSIQNITQFDLFIKNILNISKSGTIIIITYINGQKIYNELIKNNKIEITYKDKLYWGVYPFNDKSLTKVLFYMRDIIKYDIGIEENLVYPNMLINLFKDFNLIKQISFLESNIFSMLKPFQKEILFYYELLIFQLV